MKEKGNLKHLKVADAMILFLIIEIQITNSNFFFFSTLVFACRKKMSHDQKEPWDKLLSILRVFSFFFF